MRLSEDQVRKILTSTVYSAASQDGEAFKSFFRLLGFRLKECRFDFVADQVSFEIHYRIQFVVAIDAEAKSNLIGCSNEYINWGPNESGLSTAVKTVGDLLIFLYGIIFPRFIPAYEGPAFEKDLQEIYSDVNEVEKLVNIINEVVSPQEG